MHLEVQQIIAVGLLVCYKDNLKVLVQKALKRFTSLTI